MKNLKETIDNLADGIIETDSRDYTISLLKDFANAIIDEVKNVDYGLISKEAIEAKQFQAEHAKEDVHFYSTKRCFSCHYDLENDPKDLLRSSRWQDETGCPSCNRSFVE